MTAESDIAALADGGENPISEIRDALTAVLGAIPPSLQYMGRRLSGETGHTDDLFFVADGSGGHAFASTLKQHKRNVANWRKIQKKARRALDREDPL